MDPATSRRPPWGAVCALVALSVAVKLLLVLAPAADLYLVGDGRTPVSYIGEEIHRGTTAIELLNGPILPLQEYHYAPFFGGSLVVGIVAAPFFALLGPSVAALKLAPLCFDALTVALLVLVLARVAGRRAAWLGGLLLALPPPGYAILATTAFGSHVESNAFALAAVLAFLVLHGPRPAQRGRPAVAFVLGLVSGFALYFGYIVALTLVVLVAARLLRGRLGTPRRETLALGAGFALGFAPWLTYNLAHGFAGLSIYGRGPVGLQARKEGPAALEQLAGLARDGFPGAMHFGARALDLAFALALVLLALLALWQARASLVRIARAAWRQPLPAGEPAPALLFLAQPLAFVAAFALSDFAIGEPPSAVVSYRYAYVTFPFLFAAAALALDALARRGAGGRALAFAMAALLAGAGLAGTLRRVDLERFGAPLEEPGYSYPAFGRFLGLTYASDHERLIAAVERARVLRTPAELDAILFGMGGQLKQTLHPANAAARQRPRFARIAEAAEAARALLHERVPPSQRPYFEPPREGEPMFGVDERERFWKWYAAHGGADGRRGG